jgi:hypothetical protein
MVDLEKYELIDALHEALNGLNRGWMLGNVADPTERARLQAPMEAGANALLAILDRLDPVRKEA